jgi:hypothetical protein
MGMSGQLHTPATLPSKTEPPLLTEQEATYAPELFWTLWRGDKSLAPTRNWTIIPQLAIPWPCHHTNYDIWLPYSSSSHVLLLFRTMLNNETYYKENVYLNKTWELYYIFRLSWSFIYLNSCMYIYIYIYVCVCVCVCVYTHTQTYTNSETVKYCLW